MPISKVGRKYRSCCGTEICTGCIVGICKIDNKQQCPFCRAQNVNEVESTELIKGLVEKNDKKATFLLGNRYRHGIHGVEQNMGEATRLLKIAAKMGSAEAHETLGHIATNIKIKQHHFEEGSLGGNASSRFNLGVLELKIGNYNRACQHLMIAACAGVKDSLAVLKMLQRYGFATQEIYEVAEMAQQAYEEMVKNEERDYALSHPQPAILE